jgi:hypothetical protein
MLLLHLLDGRLLPWVSALALVVFMGVVFVATGLGQHFRSAIPSAIGIPAALALVAVIHYGWPLLPIAAFMALPFVGYWVAVAALVFLAAMVTRYYHSPR